MIEPAPPAANLLQDVMEAIDGKRLLRIVYKSHYQDEKEIILLPAFVRLFKQRWYVIGEVRGKERAMTCALERVKEIELLEGSKVKFSPKLRAILKPEGLF